MAIRILTDTTCEIPLESQEKLGITILPIRIFFGTEEYIDGVNITKEEFFQKLKVCEKLPTTAAINPSEFEGYFDKYMKPGDSAVCMFLSSELSGTHQNAVVARESHKYRDNIHIVDTKNVTFGLGLLVYEAIKLRDEGKTAAEMSDILNEARKKIRLWAVVDTLKYLKMGGRLSGAAAVVGTLLNIKPVICVRDGKVNSISKGKGYNKALQELIKIMKNQPADYTKGFTFGASDSPDMLQKFITDLTAVFPEIKDYVAMEIGAVVGTHIGAKCGGIAYFEK